MFTIKLYTGQGRQRIVEAESFTILRAENDSAFEVTAHKRNADDDVRFDIGPTDVQVHSPQGGRWDWAFIENANGRTVERLAPRIFHGADSNVAQAA